MPSAPAKMRYRSLQRRCGRLGLKSSDSSLHATPRNDRLAKTESDRQMSYWFEITPQNAIAARVSLIRRLPVATSFGDRIRRAASRRIDQRKVTTRSPILRRHFELDWQDHTSVAARYLLDQAVSATRQETLIAYHRDVTDPARTSVALSSR